MIGLVLGLGIGRMASTAPAVWTPATIFAASEQGVWYDPSDFSTLFQDSAGTTPVTAVGQPVGLILDKSGRGNHATQATARPVLSARVNLLTKTEDFADAAWDAFGWRTLQVSADATAAPDGTNTADKVTEALAVTGIVQHRVISDGTSTAGANKITLHAKKAERKRIYVYTYNASQGAWFDTDLGTCGAGADFPGGTASMQSVGGGWWRCQLSTTTNVTLVEVLVIGDAEEIRGARTGDGTSGIYIWGASLVPAGQVDLPYQRVNTATDYDTVGFPHGNDYDGVDDSMAQSGGGGSTTAFMLCAAVKPEGGAASARTIWSDAGTNTGYIVRLNASNQLEMAVGNGTAYTTIATTATVDVGTAYVVTAWDDGTNLNVQVNNGTVASVARPTVSAGTATATLGKDNGAATGFFNGQLISVVQVKNDGGTADERTAAKAYAAGKGGVTL